MSVELQGIIDGITKKKDGTLSIKFGTQELPPEKIVSLFNLGNQHVYMGVASMPVPVETLNVPKEESVNGKSPSQRQRSVLYVLWEQLGENGNFEDFYRQMMEKNIESYKQQLKPK